MNVPPPSGDRYALHGGGYHAEIASVGASLRSLRCQGRDLVVPFDADEIRPAMRGALLAPWPNRIRDGKYEFGGAVHQLAISEPGTFNAAHGLLAWTDFQPAVVGLDRVALTATIEPQTGYPWRLRLDVAFTLSEHGLSEEVVATNESSSTAPFGVGGHPYLVAAPPSPKAIDDWFLELPADEVLLFADRLLPTHCVQVLDYDDGRFDFRERRAIGPGILNHAFTRLHQDADGRTRVSVTNDQGSGAEIEVDDRCPWLQVYTADGECGHAYRHAVAVEPMTCPPDAFNSGRNLLQIAPGESVTAGWSIRAAQ